LRRWKKLHCLEKKTMRKAEAAESKAGVHNGGTLACAFNIYGIDGSNDPDITTGTTL
jgi:hypothetical protein